MKICVIKKGFYLYIFKTNVKTDIFVTWKKQVKLLSRHRVWCGKFYVEVRKAQKWVVQVLGLVRISKERKRWIRLGKGTLVNFGQCDRISFKNYSRCHIFHSLSFLSFFFSIVSLSQFKIVSISSYVFQFFRFYDISWQMASGSCWLGSVYCLKLLSCFLSVHEHLFDFFFPIFIKILELFYFCQGYLFTSIGIGLQILSEQRVNIIIDIL